MDRSYHELMIGERVGEAIGKPFSSWTLIISWPHRSLMVYRINIVGRESGIVSSHSNTEDDK